MAELVPVDHDPFAAPPSLVPVDHDPFAEPAAPSKGILGKAAEPITSYPETYSGMVSDATSQMGAGVSQAREALAAQPQTPAEKGQAALDFVGGVGKTALGGLGYVTSPINAALRTVVGKPVEEATGIPKEYTEFGASLALPIPKKIPSIGVTTRNAAPTVEELKGAATAAYQSPAIQGLEIKAPALTNFGQQTRAELNAMGFDENLAPKTFGILSRLENAPAGSTVTGRNIESIRRTFGKAAGSTDPTERQAATEIINRMDGWIGGIKPQDVIAGDTTAAAATAAEARGNYAAAKRSETITDAVERGNQNAAAANSGANTENALRQRIKAIIQNPRERRGYSPDELKQMGQIVRGSYTGDIVRAAGNILGGGGGLGTMLTSGVGAAASGSAWGAALPVLGFGFKKLGSVLTNNQISKLDEMVRSRAPLSRPLVNWSQVTQEFEISPTARNMARVSLASKNLSTNLRDAGISLSPQELLRAIQGPVGGSAGEEQQ